MNLLLLKESDFVSGSVAQISGSRAKHLHRTLGVQPGQSVRAGQLNGLLGTATVRNIDKGVIDLELSFKNTPPAPTPLKLIVALPRPKVLKRLVYFSTTLGIKELYFFHSYRVEKSYWCSEWVNCKKLEPYMIKGLEQAVDTVLPSISFHQRFRPFVEDHLPEIASGNGICVAHPTAKQNLANTSTAPKALVLGPEGGFIPFELDLLSKVGAVPVNLGERILKVETALQVAVAQVSALSSMGR